MATPDNTKWMVAVVNNVFQGISRSRLIQLQDPCTQERRQYVFVDDSRIVEVQSLPSDFSSFFVGRHVVQDGNLYILNHVDPLFFVLAAHGVPDETQKSSWQPFDQTIGSLPQEIRKAVVETQMGHVCQTLCNDQTDNVTYLKVSVPKALGWLQKKQERVYQCLLQQDQAKQKREGQQFSNTQQGGSVSATFNMPEDPMAATPSKQQDGDAMITSQTKQLKVDSIQIVCSYLSEDWSKKFLESTNLTREDIFPTVSSKKGVQQSRTTSTPASQAVAEETPTKKKMEASRTMGNKRLAKVNTRGMATLGSFFGAPKKKNKTQ
jgi:hypothetical protein